MSEPSESFLRQIWSDIRLLCGGLVSFLRLRWLPLLLATLGFAVFAWFVIFPEDDVWLKFVRSAGGKEAKATLKPLAQWLSKWGDFGGFTVFLSLALWVGGRVCRSRYYQRLALASLLAAGITGMTANAVRFGSGRARPSSGLADGFYGPHLKTDYQAFPSAHTATAFGSALPLLVAAPQIGVPTTVFAAGVSWSRLYLNQHHPTDVATSIWLALLFGVPLGLVARRMRK
jgi:membrane-associated phospholipid phosphatase